MAIGIKCLKAQSSKFKVQGQDFNLEHIEL